jgi:hypothetical protein
LIRGFREAVPLNAPFAAIDAQPSSGIIVKFTSAHRQTIRAILDGTYTPLDVREFVQLCYVLALPLIRSRIHHGKLNLEVLGLAESDIVYDSVADLFKRDAARNFVQVKTFFENQGIDTLTCEPDDAVLALRRLVFGKVHQAIVRLHSEADPTLGKILRNLMLELEKNQLFEHQTRFGDVCLVATSADPCFHRPPIPSEYLRQQFSKIVSIRDSIPTMVQKLHNLLLEQDEFQRVVPFLMAGLLFKEAYALGMEAEEAEESEVERQSSRNDICTVADLVCRKLALNSRYTYVGKGKKTEEVFEKYMNVVKEILLSEFGDDGSNGSPYYERLRVFIPGLTKAAYTRQHRAVLEYLAKRAKTQMRQALRKM